MANAKKLPSGNWRVNAYIYTDDNGKKIYKSFTASTKKEAEYMASVYKMEDKKEKKEGSTITLGEAVDLYIESKNKTMSPSTVRGYKIIRNNALDGISHYRLSDLTEIKLQKWVNENAEKYSPKSIRNQFALITATLKQQKVKLELDDISLVPREKIDYNIPDEEMMKKIINAVSGSEVELPVLLALMLGLRISEIAALKWGDFDGSQIHVRGAVVPDENNQLVYKSRNKSFDSHRALDIPDYLLKKLKQRKKEIKPAENDFISTISARSITRSFQRVCESKGLPKYKMHALRHANASLMLMHGIADKYAMERLGHATPTMLKTVYQHTFKEEQRNVSEKINAAFNGLCNVKGNTKYNTNL